MKRLLRELREEVASDDDSDDVNSSDIAFIKEDDGADNGEDASSYGADAADDDEDDDADVDSVDASDAAGPGKTGAVPADDDDTSPIVAADALTDADFLRLAAALQARLSPAQRKRLPVLVADAAPPPPPHRVAPAPAAAAVPASVAAAVPAPRPAPELPAAPAPTVDTMESVYQRYQFRVPIAADVERDLLFATRTLAEHVAKLLVTTPLVALASTGAAHLVGPAVGPLLVARAKANRDLNTAMKMYQTVTQPVVDAYAAHWTD